MLWSTTDMKHVLPRLCMPRRPEKPNLSETGMECRRIKRDSERDVVHLSVRVVLRVKEWRGAGKIKVAVRI
jgi:hypothetical protein